MGESYPRRDQARGLWKINDITKNIKEEGTYPLVQLEVFLQVVASPTVQSGFRFYNYRNNR